MLTYKYKYKYKSVELGNHLWRMLLMMGPAAWLDRYQRKSVLSHHHHHHHHVIIMMTMVMNREEEFDMRSCPEAANHSRYLAWDMQVKKEAILDVKMMMMMRMMICTKS